MESAASSIVVYVNFNVNDPVLKDKRVRQAVACAPWTGRRLWMPSGAGRRGWRRRCCRWGIGRRLVSCSGYPHDVERAKRLLDEAGFHAGERWYVRLRITLKTSTDETTRLMAQAMQQQLRAAGIDLRLRSAEFGTFYADVTKGAFQMYGLRWIGSNEDPEIFHNAYGSDRFPPKGANRGRFSNRRVDELLDAAAWQDVWR